jgi:hypothetical protein
MVSVCVGVGADLPPPPPPSDEDVPRVVVAVIDTAINPYHEFFHAGSDIYASAAPSAVTASVLEAFGIADQPCFELTRTGSFNADVQADSAKWGQVSRNQFVHFCGTNIIAVSVDDFESEPLKPATRKSPHGVGVTASVLTANPEAVILFIESDFDLIGLALGGASPIAENLAFTHPAVDIVTTSYGMPGAAPVPGHLVDSYTGVVRQGKLHFGACANEPTHSTVDGTCGPWWAISIAGFEEDGSEGRQLLSGFQTDFLADFTQRLPYCTDCEGDYRARTRGTSFATPLSAGVASRIVLESRRALEHLGGIAINGGVPVLAAGAGRTISNWEVRRAMEQAAYVPAFGDYDLFQGVGDTSFPVPPEAPWSVIGWGVLSPDTAFGVVEEALARLELDGTPARDKDLGYCIHQTAWILERKAYWDFHPGSQSFGAAADSDPFVYCDPLLGP